MPKTPKTPEPSAPATSPQQAPAEPEDENPVLEAPERRGVVDEERVQRLNDECPWCGLDSDCDCAYEHARAAFEDAEAEAVAFALENCQLTSVPETYDMALEMLTLGMGHRVAYTENGLRAQNRHCATNYDELIEGLDRDDPVDRAYHSAIRSRCEELVEEWLAAQKTK